MADEKRAAERPDWGRGIGLSREDELLVHCARLDLLQERRKAVKYLLTEGLDWDLLLERAAWHRLSPLVSHHLRTPDLSVLVPRPVLERLQRLNYQSLARNMLLQNELSQLLSAFNEEGIPVVVLKGAALLGSIYDDIGLRPMSDLDILVQPEHLDRAEAIALCQGYAPIADRNAQGHTTANRRHGPNLIHFEKGIVLEVHQHIVDSDSAYHFDLNGFWAKARPVSISGVPALVLSTEDQLLHLSIKFLLDRNYSSHFALGQLCDISELISGEGDSLNWDLLVRAADDHHIGPGIHYVLYTCEQLLGTQVPASMLARLQPLGFDPSMATLFIHRRLLDTRDWVPLNFMYPKVRYNRYRALLAIINKLFHIPLRMFQERESRGHKISYYFRLMKDMVPALARVLLRPIELKQDLLLDRWLHDLGSDNTRTMSPISSLEYGSTVASSSQR